MKNILTGLVFIGLFIPVSVGQIKLKKGDWTGTLTLEDKVDLPFDFFISSQNTITVKNGEEKIRLNTLKNTLSDSIDFEFPDFDSFLRVKLNNKKTISGYWYNRLKGPSYKIPFTGELKREKDVETNQNISGNWEVTFSPQTDNPYPALGVFVQKQSKITGTFLTETGDYRFLSGRIKENSITLSAFDGSHAFLFTADVSDTLSGVFYSGNHWKTNWFAIKNPNFKLRDADSITFLNGMENTVSFSFPDLSGNTFNFPSPKYEGKVVIIQLMGSWCPNCLDEALFYKDLLDQYQASGLEIITVCYEIPKTQEQKIEHVKRMAERNALGFYFLIGGDAQKNLASSHFPMLNKVVSFPTSLFLDKSGVIRRIHTGFSGPGTGSYFLDYKEKTHALIERLLAE